jgi:hypothetical protein
LQGVGHRAVTAVGALAVGLLVGVSKRTAAGRALV